MISFNSIPINKFINKNLFKVKPVREDFDKFKLELIKLNNSINIKESEEHNKNLVRDFLLNTFYSYKYVNTKGRTDLTIHLDKTASSKAGVLIEAKSPVNISDMISEDNLNCKALHEVILYYFRERIELNNDEIKYVVITNAFEWFIFRAEVFEINFFKGDLRKEYEKWRDKLKISRNTDFFYSLTKEYLDSPLCLYC
jgi:hypothetical protein